MGTTKAERLITELTDKVKLDPVDAHRAAFAALAASKGWTKARIGRYLGISRERVGQKLDKLAHYAATRRDLPTLKAAMRKAAATPAQRRASDDLVAFEVSYWEDLDQARRLIDTLD